MALFEEIEKTVAKSDSNYNSEKTGKLYDQDNGIPRILDAYFVELNYTENKTAKTKTLDYQRITERGLAYQAAIIVDTLNLVGKKLTIKIKSGREKVLSDIDEPVSLIDMEDVDKVTSDSKYKDIDSKDTFEVEVGNLSKDTKIANASDFENKAVLRLMLNGRADDLSFDMAKKIINLELKEGEEFESNNFEDPLDYNDLKAYLYIEVTSSETEVESDGLGENRDQFLNENGKHFELKYLEQPWIIKARIEYENKITQVGNAKRVIEYHQINRDYKPSKETESWCASFVGWCLHKTGFKAQLDAGAYSYGHLDTRYRRKPITKIVNGKSVPSFKMIQGKKCNTEDVFEDPIWAQKINYTGLGAICYVKTSSDHVTFSVGQRKDGKILFLGGNQGRAVKLGCYLKIVSRVYPINYTIREEDKELPIYYNAVPTGGSVTAS